MTEQVKHLILNIILISLDLRTIYQLPLSKILFSLTIHFKVYPEFILRTLWISFNQHFNIKLLQICLYFYQVLSDCNQFCISDGYWEKIVISIGGVISLTGKIELITVTFGTYFLSTWEVSIILKGNKLCLDIKLYLLYINVFIKEIKDTFQPLFCYNII